MGFFNTMDLWLYHEEKKKKWHQDHGVMVQNYDHQYLSREKNLSSFFYHESFPQPHGFYKDESLKVTLKWTQEKQGSNNYGKELLERKKIINFQDPFWEKPIPFSSKIPSLWLHKNKSNEKFLQRFLWKDVGFLHQVHSSTLCYPQYLKFSKSQDSFLDSLAQKQSPETFWPEGDGWLSPFPLEKPLGILTADCVPFIVWDAETNIFGALHGGWRGCAQGILTKALEAIKSLKEKNCASVVGGSSVTTRDFFKTSLHVLIGPSIGPHFYKVSKDVVEALQKEQENHQQHWNLKTHGQWFFLHHGVYYVDLCFYAQCLLEPLVHKLYILSEDTYGSTYSHRYAIDHCLSHYFLIKTLIFPSL